MNIDKKTLKIRKKSGILTAISSSNLFANPFKNEEIFIMEINVELLTKDIQDKLLKANLITATRILRLSETELQKVGNFTTEDVKSIFLLASEKILQPSSICELPKITIGCDKLDGVLGGGLKCSAGINELAGESGCGKTQFCLQLTLTAQNPISLGGINKCVLYICTEDNFPSKRLIELMNNLPPPFKSRNEISYGDRIYIEHSSDLKSLKECLFERLPHFVNAGNIGLLIIDSIAAIFRSTYTIEEGIQRARDLRSIGFQLHFLSKKFNLCVLCVNQITAAISKQNGDENDLTPALGLAWANLVTTRILLKKNELQETRRFELVFSPHSGPEFCNYIITKSGLKGI